MFAEILERHKLLGTLYSEGSQSVEEDVPQGLAMTFQVYPMDRVDLPQNEHRMLPTVDFPIAAKAEVADLSRGPTAIRTLVRSSH